MQVPGGGDDLTGGAMLEQAGRRWRPVRAAVLTACVAVVLAGCGGSRGREADPVPSASASAEGAVPDDYAAVVADDVVGSLAEQGVPGVREFDPEAAYLQGPHFHFGIEEVAEVTAFEPRNRNRLTLAGKPFGTLRARPGGALLLALLHQPSDPHAKAEPVNARALVVVAGQSRNIGEVGRSRDTLIAVAVPPGVDATLVVSDNGRVQSISLRTGARGRDAVAAYHPLRAGNRTLTDGIEISGLERRLQLTGSVLARKYPYVAGRGWAQPGRIWLTVDVEVGTIAARYTCELDAARSFTVRGSVGTVPVPATTIVATSIADNSGSVTRTASVVMDIAEAPVTLNVAFTAHGVCRTLDGRTSDHRRFNLQNRGKISVR